MTGVPTLDNGQPLEAPVNPHDIIRRRRSGLRALPGRLHDFQDNGGQQQVAARSLGRLASLALVVSGVDRGVWVPARQRGAQLEVAPVRRVAAAAERR